jgi:hypothetical protein
MGIPSWEKAFEGISLGDERRIKRVIKTAKQIENISEKKGASGVLCGNHELKAVSRFLRTQEVTPKKLIEGYARESCGSITESHVLVVEDTTELNFAWRKKNIPGLGPTGNGEDQGFFMHPAIVIEPKEGHVLGLAGLEVIKREYGERTTENEAHKGKEIEDKESYRWITVPREGCENLPDRIIKTVVADREADIYDLFLMHHKGEMGKNVELLIRASRNRKIGEGEGYLFDEIETWERVHGVEIEVSATKKKPKRTAVCGIRYGKITMEIPKTQRHRKGKERIPEIYVVDVREENPPDVSDAVHWTLLTTWEVNTIEEALQKVEWYRRRWLIEELFRVLKSGYQVESVRFEDGHALMNWCALRLMMAIKVMYLRTHREDERPETAKDAFTDIEIEVLEACEDELIPEKSTIHRPPKKTNAWAALLVAILGGYKATPSAKPFGHVCLWRGLARLEGAVIGYRAAKKKCG